LIVIVYSKKYLAPIEASRAKPDEGVISNDGTISTNISIGVSRGSQAIS